MKIQYLGLSILAFAVIPAVSQATSPLDACVKAFTQTLSAPGEASPAYKVVNQLDRVVAPQQYFPTEYTFDLQATDPKTGDPSARVRCTVSERGRVYSLSPLPLLANAQHSSQRPVLSASAGN